MTSFAGGPACIRVGVAKGFCMPLTVGMAILPGSLVELALGCVGWLGLANKGSSL